jgi:hypothetical protein
VTPDKFVAIIGLVMALVLVLSNRDVRQMRWRSHAWMVAAWGAIILVAAIAFAGYRR